MSETNMIEIPITVESPKSIPNELLNVYIPVATYKRKGLVSFNVDDFNISTDGEVSLSYFNRHGQWINQGINRYSLCSENSIAGVKGYYVVELDPPYAGHMPEGATRSLRISKRQLGDSEFSESIKNPYEWVGQYITINNGSKYINCSKVIKASNCYLYVDTLPFGELDWDRTHNTDGAVFMLAKPNEGEVDFGQYAFAVGDNCMSLNYAAFSAGRDNMSLGQYGTTFGRDNTAGYCSFTIGRSNRNLGDHSIVGGKGNTNELTAYGSFISGVSNYNAGQRAMLFGSNNKNNPDNLSPTKYGYNSFVGGSGNTNYGNQSLLNGTGNTNHSPNAMLIGTSNTNNAKGERSLLLGNSNHNEGQNAIVGGYNCKNYSNGGTINGNSNTLKNGNNVAFCMNNTNEGSYSAIFGYGNMNELTGRGALVFGGVIGEGTFKRNLNKSSSSIVGGYGNEVYQSATASIVSGDSNVNYGARSILSGHSSTNKGINCLVVGYNCQNEASNCSLIVGDNINNINNRVKENGEPDGGHLLIAGIGHNVENSDCCTISGARHIVKTSEYSTLLGYGNQVNGWNNVTIIGYNNSANAHGQVLLGIRAKATNIAYGDGISEVTVFAVGDGSANAGAYEQINAFEISKRGGVYKAKLGNGDNEKLLATENYVDGEISVLNDKINKLGNISNGSNIGVSYDSYTDMIGELNYASKNLLSVGNSIYIRTQNVPDLWVYNISTQSTHYTYSNDNALINALNQGPVQIGHFLLAPLETQKVDLTDYVKNTTFNTALNNKMNVPDIGSYTRVPAIRGTNSSNPGEQIHHSITDAAAAGTLMYRNSTDGTCKISSPKSNSDIANKKYVDDEIDKLESEIETLRDTLDNLGLINFTVSNRRTGVSYSCVCLPGMSWENFINSDYSKRSDIVFSIVFDDFGYGEGYYVYAKDSSGGSYLDGAITKTSQIQRGDSYDFYG